MSNRLTPDVTYNGLPLRKGAWDIHLLILEGYRTTMPIQDQESRDFHEAAVAIRQAGLLIDVSGSASPTDFRWCDYRLSPYGEMYLAQRS